MELEKKKTIVPTRLGRSILAIGGKLRQRINICYGLVLKTIFIHKIEELLIVVSEEYKSVYEEIVHKLLTKVIVKIDYKDPFNKKKLRSK